MRAYIMRVYIMRENLVTHAVDAFDDHAPSMSEQGVRVCVRLHLYLVNR
jgi:hypothetical protein